MGLMDWFKRRSVLQLAFERGIQPGANLESELRKLGDIKVHSKSDAETICRLLDAMENEPALGGESAREAVIGLFERVDGAKCPAIGVFAVKGFPRLKRLVDRVLTGRDIGSAEDALSALRVLAYFGDAEGTDAILRAVRLPLLPDSWRWRSVFEEFNSAHDDRDRLFEAAGNPLPVDGIAKTLISAANRLCLAGELEGHPYDSPEGMEQIRQWVGEADPELAYAGCVALAFIQESGRDELLDMALAYPDSDVQLEAAWAGAKCGHGRAIRRLASACLDINRAAQGRRYLIELGLRDAIPAEADEPDFAARARFAEWIAHPMEMGRAPDEVEVVDSRELEWPLERKMIPLWLVRYRIKDETGLKDDDEDIGLVGSITFCFFAYELRQRPPEDGYAIHCYWELQKADLIAESEIEPSSNEYDGMLRHHSVEGITDAKMKWVAELSAELRAKRSIVGLASAKHGDEPGWLILDGPDSRWYPASDMPEDQSDRTVLMIHVGRSLLGFDAESDRRRWLKPKPVRRPEDTIRAYERLLDRCRNDRSEAVKLLKRGVLGSAFDDYVVALANTTGRSTELCLCGAYESLLAIAAGIQPDYTGELFDSFAPVGAKLEQYGEALVATGRSNEVAPLVERFRAAFDHNLGYSTLGKMAFRAGENRLAESLFIKVRENCDAWARGEDMDQLATIYHRTGRLDEARRLLTEAMKQLLNESRTATGSDCNLFEEWYRSKRQSFLMLFPESETELKSAGLPESTQ